MAGSILGTRVLRTEDPKFLTVGGTYVADVRDPLLEGALYVTYVRSTVAHGAITGSYLAVHRIARCNPWCQAGHDPVPQHPWIGVKRQSDRAHQLFTRLLNRADS